MKVKEAALLPGERLDDLQRGGFFLIQNPARFCFGMDAVLLSAFARVSAGARVMDLCTGTGVVPTLLYARSAHGSYVGLEIDAYSCDMARRSVACNGLQDIICIQQGDVKEADRMFPAASFDVVTVNPPYMPAGGGLTGDNLPLAAARHEISCSLEDVVRAGSHLLKSRGRMYLVHRPFRLPRLLECLRSFHLEPKRLQMVHPMADQEANMVLVEALKGGRSYLTVQPPLIAYSAPGIYTAQMRRLYEE